MAAGARYAADAGGLAVRARAVVRRDLGTQYDNAHYNDDADTDGRDDPLASRQGEATPCCRE